MKTSRALKASAIPTEASRRRHGRLHLKTIRQIMTSPLESTAVQSGVLVRALNLHRDEKNVGENRGEMESSLVTQDFTHRGFC